eukprot:3791037-Pyramimonas_sp.AAC.1
MYVHRVNHRESETDGPSRILWDDDSSQQKLDDGMWIQVTTTYVWVKLHALIPNGMRSRRKML